jgi:hypothetical protein
MSTPNKINARQIISSDVLSKIALAAGTTVQDLLKSLNSESTSPFQILADSPSDLGVTIGSSRVKNPITNLTHTVSPLAGDVPLFTSGTIVFPATSGGTAVVTPGNNSIITVASGQWIKATVYLDATLSLNILTGTAGASEALATTAAAPSGTIGIGYISLQNVGGVIQNITNSNIYQFVGTGSGTGGSGSGTGDDLDSLLFRASFNENFPESAISTSSSVNAAAGNTNAVYSAVKSMWAMSYDAAKTITTSGTTATMSSAPAYTVVAGDVIQSGGIVRKITAVASQTSYTLESAFPSNLSAAACCVSQAVITKDIYNLAVDGTSLASAFGSSTFSEILVDYKDNATVGSNLFTPNTTPLVAFVASPNNTSFTSVQARATNETDLVNDTNLPSAGTSLYLRFFSNASAGSGTVNLINYRAFMQKSTISSSGGVQNTAYAFTNSVGTPVNCTVGVSGGKTVITLNFQYAVGVNSSSRSPYGSLDVYLNGQLLPRFIDSTLTPDGSYTETSPSIITLDKDYSASNLSLEVIQRVAVIDTNTTNTTAISNLNETVQNGFQGFINTSNVRSATATTGAPAAGTFYSTVVNRANIVDISQDLKVSMGIDRLEVQQLVQLQSEFGPNGELVWSAVNDDRGLIRFVGGAWKNVINTQGNQVYTNGNIVDYVEITFYGTGLNWLTLPNTNNHDARVSIDGAAEGSNILSASYSSVILGRNYAANSVINVTSGLTLGVHTVKIRNNSAATGSFDVCGFEILNEALTLKVNPGSAYINGNKLALASAQSPAYNSVFDSGTLGTKGGRVVTYLKSDGTIGKSVTPTNAAQANLTSADHTNEEIARRNSWREFGAGRTDDFSIFSSGSSTNLAFTQEDGTTTLIGSSVRVGASTEGDIVLPNVSSGFISVTFVGTGLDVIQGGDIGSSTIDTNTITVDGGASIGSLGTSGALNSPAWRKTVKVVSGLPYGTHTIKFTRTAVSTGIYSIFGFIIYQPKTPSLPSGAVQLGSYNVMANFVANTVGGQDTVSTGVLRKVGSREFTYVGASWIAPALSVNALSGFIMQANTTGDYLQYTFFGTGIDFRTTNSGGGSPTTWQFTLTDAANPSGITNFSGFTTSFYGAAMTFTASTGTFSLSNSSSNGNGVVISGLAMGWHTVKCARTGGTGFISFEAIDVITPIHSPKSNINYDQQNTLPVGSQAISDDRKITPIKDINLQKKNISQTFGASVSPTVTSTSLVPMPDMGTIHPNSSGRLRISYNALVVSSASGGVVGAQIYVDGIPIGQLKQFVAPVGNAYGIVSDAVFVTVSPGTHKVDVYWSVSTGTGTAVSTFRNLLVEEV